MKNAHEIYIYALVARGRLAATHALKNHIGDVSFAALKNQLLVEIGGRLKAKDKYKQCQTWQCKVKCIGIYHAFTVALRRGASVRKTASYFEVSIGTVSESLLLFKYVKHMRKIRTRKEALEIVRSR